MLYSTRMGRGGTPGQVTELLKVAIEKTVQFGFDQCEILQPDIDFLLINIRQIQMLPIL